MSRLITCHSILQRGVPTSSTIHEDPMKTRMPGPEWLYVENATPSRLRFNGTGPGNRRQVADRFNGQSR